MFPTCTFMLQTWCSGFLFLPHLVGSRVTRTICLYLLLIHQCYYLWTSIIRDIQLARSHYPLSLSQFFNYIFSSKDFLLNWNYTIVLMFLCVFKGVLWVQSLSKGIWNSEPVEMMFTSFSELWLCSSHAAFQSRFSYQIPVDFKTHH